MALTVWNVIFSSQTQVFGYSQASMTSYVFLASFLQSLILASSLHNLAGEIYSGNISMQLLKPQSLFANFATVETADKLRNLLFSFGEAVILFAVFQPGLVLPSFGTVLLFVIWSVLGAIIHFYITILFGTLGFWSPSTWGPKFLFFMVLDFAAGKLYPLDILPKILQNILFLTPFPYFSYAQTQLFLNRYSLEQIALNTASLLFWTILSWLLTTWVWKKGIRSYEAAGQ